MYSLPSSEPVDAVAKDRLIRAELSLSRWRRNRPYCCCYVRRRVAEGRRLQQSHPCPRRLACCQRDALCGDPVPSTGSERGQGWRCPRRPLPLHTALRIGGKSASTGTCARGAGVLRHHHPAPHAGGSRRRPLARPLGLHRSPVHRGFLLLRRLEGGELRRRATRRGGAPPLWPRAGVRAGALPPGHLTLPYREVNCSRALIVGPGQQVKSSACHWPAPLPCCLGAIIEDGTSASTLHYSSPLLLRATHSRCRHQRHSLSPEQLDLKPLRLRPLPPLLGQPDTQRGAGSRSWRSKAPGPPRRRPPRQGPGAVQRGASVCSLPTSGSVFSAPRKNETSGYMYKTEICIDLEFMLVDPEDSRYTEMI